MVDVGHEQRRLRHPHHDSSPGRRPRPGPANRSEPGPEQLRRPQTPPNTTSGRSPTHQPAPDRTTRNPVATGNSVSLQPGPPGPFRRAAPSSRDCAWSPKQLQARARFRVGTDRQLGLRRASRTQPREPALDPLLDHVCSSAEVADGRAGPLRHHEGVPLHTLGGNRHHHVRAGHGRRLPRWRDSRLTTRRTVRAVSNRRRIIAEQRPDGADRVRCWCSPSARRQRAARRCQASRTRAAAACRLSSWGDEQGVCDLVVRAALGRQPGYSKLARVRRVAPASLRRAVVWPLGLAGGSVRANQPPAVQRLGDRDHAAFDDRAVAAAARECQRVTAGMEAAVAMGEYQLPVTGAGRYRHACGVRDSAA